VNAKTNYTFVGLFVIVSGLLIFLFVIWMLQPTGEEELQRYRIEFSESVSGLNVDSPVKYRGVTIGKVKVIRINPENVEKIEVIIEVSQDTPIKVDTVAKLKPQGITGLSYVELSRGSSEAQLLRPKDDDDIPLIPSEPSFFVKIERSFGSASENLSSILIQLKNLLGDENREQINRLLLHLANIAEKGDRAMTPERFEHFDKTVVAVGELARRLKAETTELDALMRSGRAMADQATVSMASLQESFATMAETMRVLNERNKNGDYSVKETMGPGMKEFEMTMRRSQETLILINGLLQRYGNNPSGIFLEYRPPMKGPGERQP